MRKRFLVGGLVLVVVATALMGITHRPVTARANGGGGLTCVANTAYCLVLTGDSRTPGDEIQLANPNTANVVQDAFIWNLAAQHVATQADFPNNEGLCDRYCGDEIYYIEKSLSGGGHDGCIYTTSSLSYPVWQPCTGEGTKIEWVGSSTGYLSNVEVDNAVGSARVMTVSENSNGTCNYAIVFQAATGQHCNLPFVGV